MATDQDLNQYMSVKRYAPYRAEKWDSNRGERLKEFREKLKGHVGDNGMSHRSEDATQKKRLGKKERQKRRAAATADGDVDKGKAGVEAAGEVSDKKRKITSEDPEDGVEGPGMNGSHKKKRRRKHKSGVQAE